MRMSTRRRYLIFAAANVYPHGKCGDNAKWKLIDGVLTIYGTGALWYGNALTYMVYKDQIIDLVVEDGIEKINGYNFDGCNQIQTVTLTPSVTDIQPQSFRNCSSLNEIQYLGTFTEWGDHTKSPLLSANQNPKNLYCNGIPPVLVDLSASTSIAGSTYYSINTIEKVITGDSCTSIGDYAFFRCEGLSEFVFGGSLASIGAQAFTDTALTTVSLPATLTTLGGNAFLRVPVNAVYYAGTPAQYDAMTFPNGFSNGFSLYCGGVLQENITVSKATLNFGYRKCKSTKNVTIAGTVTNVPDYAFEGNSNLQTVRFNGTPTMGGTHIFGNCPLLTDIYVPWAQGAVAGAPWSAMNATIHYNS